MLQALRKVPEWYKRRTGGLQSFDSIVLSEVGVGLLYKWLGPNFLLTDARRRHIFQVVGSAPSGF